LTKTKSVKLIQQIDRFNKTEIAI